MPFDTILLDVGLALILFFVMNWIGGYAVVTSRYFQLSYFGTNDEAPAFNALFRILAPSVYIIIVATAAYSIGLGEYVRGIYWVVIAQIAIRWLYNLVFGRRYLLRWRRQFALAIATIGVAYLIYRQVLIDPARLLPDPADLRNELWVAILLFVYKLFDAHGAHAHADESARGRYLKARYASLRQTYGKVVDQVVDDDVKPLVYAVMIYETFNRPAWIQWAESHMLFPLGLAKTLGPMQVHTATRISNEESVRIGAERLRDVFRKTLDETQREHSSPSRANAVQHPQQAEWIRRQAMVEAADRAASTFNVRSDYSREIRSILAAIVRFDSDLKRDLSSG